MVDWDGTYFLGIDADIFGDGTSKFRPLDAHAEALISSNSKHLQKGIDTASWTPPVTNNSYGSANKTRIYASVQWMTCIPPIPFLVASDIESIEITGLAQVDNSDSGAAIDHEIEVVIPGFVRRRFTVANTGITWKAFRWTIPINAAPEDDTWSAIQVFSRSNIGDAIGSASVGVFTDRNGLTRVGGWTETPSSSTVTSAVNEAKCVGLVGNDYAIYFDTVHLWDDTDVSNPLMMVSPRLDSWQNAGANVYEFGLSWMQLAGVTIQTKYRST